jgi:hypothetical protein
MAVDGLATDVHYTYDETSSVRDVRTLALTTGRDNLQMWFAQVGSVIAFREPFCSAAATVEVL